MVWVDRVEDRQRRVQDGLDLERIDRLLYLLSGLDRFVVGVGGVEELDPFLAEDRLSADLRANVVRDGVHLVGEQGQADAALAPVKPGDAVDPADKHAASLDVTALA